MKNKSVLFHIGNVLLSAAGILFLNTMVTAGIGSGNFGFPVLAADVLLLIPMYLLFRRADRKSKE